MLLFQIYYVCNTPELEWTELPKVTPEQINVAQQIKAYFTGNLESKVNITIITSIQVYQVLYSINIFRKPFLIVSEHYEKALRSQFKLMDS